MKIHIAIDSSSEIVIKGKVHVYAVKSAVDSSRKAKSPVANAKAKIKNEHMRKHTPKMSEKKSKVSSPPAVPKMSAYEKQRMANIAANKAKMMELGMMSMTKLRNVASPRKTTPKSIRTSPRKLSAKRTIFSGGNEDGEDDWVPKKLKYTLAEDADEASKEGYRLRCDELHLVHKILCLGEPMAVKDNAVAYDVLINVIDARIREADNLPWDCCIVNTAPGSSSGVHWNLAMWRLHRNRVQVTLWEPYSHNKYSGHIKEQLMAKFPTANVNSFTTGVQKRGDGWRCGYICVWWQILVMQLMAEDCAPRTWEAPTPPPQRWVALV